jgi:hypothetical protein
LGEKVDEPLEGPLVAVDPEEVDLKISLAKNPLKRDTKMTFNLEGYFQNNNKQSDQKKEQLSNQNKVKNKKLLMLFTFLRLRTEELRFSVQL